MKEYFAQVRRAGFDIGLSTGKLTKAMVEVLSQLPPEVPPSKEVVVQHLGLLGQMSKTRDINTAWKSAKRQAVREHPDRFRLDGKILRRRADDSRLASVHIRYGRRSGAPRFHAPGSARWT